VTRAPSFITIMTAPGVVAPLAGAAAAVLVEPLVEEPVAAPVVLADVSVEEAAGAAAGATPPWVYELYVPVSVTLEPTAGGVLKGSFMLKVKSAVFD